MPRIVTTLEFAAKAKDRTWQMMTRIYEQLARVINGGISFGHAPVAGLPDGAVRPPDRSFSDNIDCMWLEVTIPAAAQDFVIHHNLGRPLNAYIIARKANPVDIYDSPNNLNTSINRTPNQTYIVRATAPAQMVLLLF